MVTRTALRSLRLALAVVMVVATLVGVAAGPAQAVVNDAKGSAFGVFANIGFFGGPAFTDGPAPTVTLPPGGSGPINASAPTRFIQFGPAVLFSSNSQTVSTQGTIGAGGSVTSSATVNNVNTSTEETFSATSISSSCTASDGGARSGTATVTGGMVQISEGAPGVDGDEVWVLVPANPAPNTVIHGVIEGVGDSFDYVFNEQILNPDGSITVSAGHQKLYGPSAFGDIWVAQSVCGVNPGGGRYTPLTPSRILDTRDGTGGIASPIGNQATVDVQITGRGGVPATGVSAVAMNVTVTQPTAAGYLTLSPAGLPRPFTANLNFAPAQTVPNLVVVKVGTGGKIRLFNSAGNSHVIFDVAGYYSDSGTGADGRYTALVPARILDTRSTVRLGPGATLDLQVSGQGGVPTTGAKAVTLNVAVTNTTATSYLTVFPTGVTRPLAANLNWNGGDTVSNRVKATLGTGGKISIYNDGGQADVIVDVGGWYSDATVAGTTGAFTALLPARILDTRNGTGGVVGPIAGGTSVGVQITGQGGVPPTGVSAVILNATVTGTTGAGYLTISPTGSPMPLAADLNYAAGETRPNLVVVRVGTGGKVNLFTAAGTHVIFDVAGYFN